MKKLVVYFFYFLLLSVLFFFGALSTIGIETNRFNKIITNKIDKSFSNVNLILDSIKFKLDVRELSLFIVTLNPKIKYNKLEVPVKSIKGYVDFLSLFKASPNINKVNIILDKLQIQEIKKLSFLIKPSNVKSLINNNVKKGIFNTEIEIYLDSNNSVDNYIVRGSVSDLELKVTKNIKFENAKFNFFSDKTDILIKNISGRIKNLSIQDGDLTIDLDKEITLKSNFVTSLILEANEIKNYNSIYKDLKIVENFKNLKATLNNNLLIIFDQTYKIKSYNLNSKGKIDNANFKNKNNIKNYFYETIEELSLKNTEIETNFNLEKIDIKANGKYSINKENFLKFDFKSKFSKEDFFLNLIAKYDQLIQLDFINYEKPKGLVATISVNLEKKKDEVVFNKLSYNEKDNLILANNIKINKYNLISFDKISFRTHKNGELNNDFSIDLKDKISIKGAKFDSTNLPRFFKDKGNKNYLAKISKELIIEIDKTIVPLSKNLENFKLIGLLDKGKFSKISAKGDFGKNQHLDISLRNDKTNKKSYLEIYSDLPQPLLTEFSFFKGLSGGKLFFSSVIEDKTSSSKLIIEDFKVVNAPGMVKLLSLADLGGLADLAKGEGLSFAILEINMEKSNEMLKLNEIYAVGPSISVLMEGYKDKNELTSLRGTLVPAKNLNKFLSKIPVIGEIIIPKEAGEGLFGISFKMKGPPGEIKTTINPVRTLTPRFLQKIIDKNRKSK